MKTHYAAIIKNISDKTFSCNIIMFIIILCDNIKKVMFLISEGLLNILSAYIYLFLFYINYILITLKRDSIMINF